MWGKSLTLGKVAAYLPGFVSEAVLQKVLSKKNFKADDNAMYLYTSFIEMIWPYDDRGRLRGEDVWEPDSDKADIAKLDPTDVLTTAQARNALDCGPEG